MRGEGRKWYQPAPVSLERRVLDGCSQGNPPRRVNNFPTCILGIFQITVFTLSVTKLFACLEQHSIPWALSQPSLLSFKIPPFHDLVWLGSVLVFWERVSPPWKLCSFNLGKQLCQSAGVVEIGAKKPIQPVSLLAALSRCLCIYAEG